MMQLADWAAVEGEIDRIIRESVDKPFDQGTIANAHEFARFAREHCLIPEITKGYWNTICFSWGTKPPIEVEVFGDRFEIYRFYEGRTDIGEVRHTPGSPFPRDFERDLPRRSSS